MFTNYYVNNLLVIHHFEWYAQLISSCITENEYIILKKVKNEKSPPHTTESHSFNNLY